MRVEQGNGTDQRTRPKVSQLSLRSLFGRLKDDAAKLIRAEVRLARAEVNDAVRGYISGISRMGIAIVLALFAGFAGVAALIVAVTALLSEVMVPVWAAALASVIVAAVLGAAAFVAFKVGQKRLRAESLVPKATIASLKEDAEWMRNKLT